MVILFKGTDSFDNYAPQALALSAGLSAVKYLRKTLVIQLTAKDPVEQYVNGKKIREQSLGNENYLFEDTGMDSLTRRAGITEFNESHFANAVLPVVSSENLFDILKVSKKVEADIEREIVKDPQSIGTIIKSAKKIYDNIFVLCNAKAPDVIKAVIPYADKSVTCISQGKKQEIISPACMENYFLITEYDYKSIFSAHHMMKTYDLKKIFTMPYNVDFKDSCINENMIQFILSNTSPDKNDYSYHLIDEMSRLTRTLINDEESEENEYQFTKNTFKRYAKKPVFLDGDNVRVEVRKKRLFKKEKSFVHVSMKEKFSKDAYMGKDDTTSKGIRENEKNRQGKRNDKKIGTHMQGLERKEA